MQARAGMCMRVSVTLGVAPIVSTGVMFQGGVGRFTWGLFDFSLRCCVIKGNLPSGSSV